VSRLSVSQPVPPIPTARPVARLATELRLSGSGQAAIGFAGLLVAVFAGDVSPARAFVPFAVVMLLIGGLSWWSTRWMRDGRPVPAKDPAARIEGPRDTLRRCLVGLVLAVVAVGLVGAAGAGLAAVLGGVVAAVGAVDLINHRHVRAREEATGEAIYRELGSSPFAAGRRPLYTLPLNESTLAM
jgi:hypothetical protein